MEMKEFQNKLDINEENKSIDNNNIKDEIPDDKINFINKLNELRNFDAISHFKENIIHFSKNCSEPIKDLSYYCFTCKHSICHECGFNEHKDHILVQRDNCLNYDNTFFNEISKVIDRGINIEIKKSQIKKEVLKSFSFIKEQLDILEKEKLKEIDNIFKDIKDNFINLKANYITTKECIENYYKTNKKFFNIKIEKTMQNNNNEPTINKERKNNSLILDNNNKSEFKNNYYDVKESDTGPNRDIENTVFLMNFELMNLCDNKNLQILDISNNINKKIKDMYKSIGENTNSLIEELKKNFLNFNSFGINTKFDDFYWDIKVRCQKYIDHISQFQSILYDIYKRNGCLEKLKDLLILFDSKNNKGKDILFNQQFFIKMHDLSNLKKDMVKNMTKKLYLSNGKIRSNSKNKYKLTSQKTTNDKKDENKRSNKSLSKTKSNKQIKKGNIENLNNLNNLNNEAEVKLEIRKSPTNMSRNIPTNLSRNTPTTNIIPKKENIILNQRLIQRFYAYSVLDFYSKHFKVIIDNSNTEYDEENNIYCNKINSNSTIPKPKNSRYSSAKKNSRNANRSRSIGTKNSYDSNAKSLKNKEILNANASTGNLLGDPKNIKSKYKNIKSVSLLSNYTERYTEQKEKVKPIINTNYIQLFDPMTTKITKIKVPLSKEEHGYTTFPDGCRHLFIDSDLYITGGTDNCGYPINIVLMYNIDIGELTRISNLNDNHSYHSIEYLENFDSIIVVGGENSSSCEIMDLDSKKWTKLPSLNYPRANSNIYYNNMTSDLFVLFGMEGEMTEKTKNTDVIEVLELNDIIGGWMMVDYYKSVGLDLKNNYCITLPFTRDKLLIYGGSSARSIEKRLFAIFDMIKNECIKVDSATMDLIKQEENKIRAFDNAIEKMSS